VNRDADRVGSLKAGDYTSYIESRRRLLLKVLLSIFVVVAVVFIPVNVYHEAWPLAVFEVAILIFSGAMVYFLRNPDNLTACCYTFVCVGAVWAIIASALPSSDYSIFVWNAYVPAFSFFLIGKKWGLRICYIFLPAVVGIFLLRHTTDAIDQSIDVILNLIAYTMSISVLYLFYESTRAHTEADLVRDIEQRIRTEEQLKSALAEVKHLSGLLPVCSCCKKIRDDKGYWNRLEVYIEDRSEAQFSHGLCPNCAKGMYPDVGVDFKALYESEFPGWTDESQKVVDQQQSGGMG